MNTLFAIADPNAPLEEWVQRCPRELLERMYFYAMNEASMALKRVEIAQEQLENERGLPNVHKEGIYSIRMRGGVRSPEFIASHSFISTMLIDPTKYKEEIIDLLTGMVS